MGKNVLSHFHITLVSSVRGDNGTPLHYSCLENPMDRGAWWAAVHGVAKSRTRLSDFTFTFHFHTLEWVAISFSNAWKWKVKVKSFSHARLLATPWTAAHQDTPSMGFSRQEYWSGVPLPSPANVHKKLLILITQVSRRKYFSEIISYLKGNIPGGSEGEVSVYSAADLGSIPGSGRFPGDGNGNPFPYSCLENPMDRGAWCPWGHKELGMTEWLHFHFKNQKRKKNDIISQLKHIHCQQLHHSLPVLNERL